ncbi:MAG: hypothetical protein NTW72_15525, partial [Gemmatimonadetes bacterium]|nr:hypothetical protein [Gemmatimonadota bacterium]
MTFHTRAVFPRGFHCASRNVGLKPEARDLTLFASDVDAVAVDRQLERPPTPGTPHDLVFDHRAGVLHRAALRRARHGR